MTGCVVVFGLLGCGWIRCSFGCIGADCFCLCSGCDLVLVFNSVVMLVLY